jgi:glutamine synthetase type III
LRFSKAVDDLEDVIEDKTGLDLEISEVINEVLEEVLDKTEEVLDDIKEDGVLDESLSDVLKELGDTLESIAKAIKAMTVSQLKDLLKKQGLPITGKKNDLLERLLALLK